MKQFSLPTVSIPAYYEAATVKNFVNYNVALGIFPADAVVAKIKNGYSVIVGAINGGKFAPLPSI